MHSCYNLNMPKLALGQVQKTSQIQTQRLSQRQIQTLNFIGMNSNELRDEILSAVEENPALELVSDSFSEGTSSLRRKNEMSSVHTGTVSASGEQASHDFQVMLETAPSPEQTLQEHLLEQLSITGSSPEETELCEKLIQNLDQNGFHIFAPAVYLDKNNPLHTMKFLEKCLSKIQHFDPPGICVENVSQSLFLQASLRPDSPELVLFILDGHLDFINPPVPEKVRRKILDFLEEREKLSFQDSDEPLIQKNQVTVSKVQEAIDFIKTLNPYPAREYGFSSSNYVRPDVYVTLNYGSLEKEDLEKGLVADGENSYFRILPANDILPVVQVAPDFKSAASAGEKDSGAKQFVRGQVQAAESFLDTLNFRNQVIISACSHLVQKQKDFFEKGPGNLKPLTQRQFAETIGIHESTVSRIADSKFLHCEWGTFPLKYFFTTAIHKKITMDDVSAGDTRTEVSTDTVMLEIEKILSSQKPGEKRLSDQKIADMLSEKGYQIARRTVAKYRSRLNIASSYSR